MCQNLLKVIKYERPNEMRFKTIMLRLFTTFIICLSISFNIGFYSQHVVLEQRRAANNIMLNDKFTKIYETLEAISAKYNIVADTSMRVQHYAKPHMVYQDFCPECGDLWGKKKENVIFVPIDQLSKLYEMERIVLNLPEQIKLSPELEPPVNIETELTSLLLILKSQSSFVHSLTQIEENTNHYIKNHTHISPGRIGKCPECIELYEKQTTLTQPISKKRHEELLKIKNGFNASTN